LNKSARLDHYAEQATACYDVGVGKMLSDATKGSCNVFTSSGKPRSVDEDALVPCTMTGATGSSFAGLIGSTTDSWVDEVSEPL